MSGGHDDNLTLSIAPQSPGTLQRLGGPYAAVAPLLAGVCAGRGMGLRLALLGDYRGTDTVGRLDTHSAELRGWLPRWGPLRHHLSVGGGAFLTSRFPEDEYLFAGGELGLSLALSDELILALVARADRRIMRAEAPAAGAPAGTATRNSDWLLAPSLRLGWQPTSYLKLEPAASLLDVRAATSASPLFRRWQGGMAVTGLWRRLTMVGEGWGSRLSYVEAAETHVGGRVELRLELAPTMELRASAEVAEPVSAGATRDYARRLFTLGVSFRASHERRPAPRRPPELRPQVKGDEVRFRYRAREATAITVVGSWDDWAAPGSPMSPAGPGGLWELSTRLPAGTHRYHFIVDGKPQRPPEAIRYVADDFGSEDGVIEVGAPAGGHTASPQAAGDAP